MARVEDRWLKRDRKTRTSEYGTRLRWRAVWKEPGGDVKRKSFATKDAAAAHLIDVQAAISNGTYQRPDSGSLTVGEWAEHWYLAQAHQREGSKEQIRRRLDRNILPTLGAVPLRDLSRGHIQAAVATWSETLAPSTIKTAYVYLAGLLNAAVLDKHLTVVPTAGVNLPKVEKVLIRPISVPTVQALVGVLPKDYKTAAVFAAATGLRPSELWGLTWDRIDLNAGVVTVDRQLVKRGPDGTPTLGPLKTDYSYRPVKIGAASILLLKQLREESKTELVFVNSRKRAVYRNMRSQVWQTAREKVPGIGDGWHQLRHHHASLLIAAGLSPVAVAHRLGHKDANETLKTYAHLWPNDDDRMVAASDGMVVWPEA